VRPIRRLTLPVIWIAYTVLMLSCTRGTDSGEWRFYASDSASTKFSSLSQIELTIGLAGCAAVAELSPGNLIEA
jgi:hypothetical protein